MRVRANRTTHDADVAGRRFFLVLWLSYPSPRRSAPVLRPFSPGLVQFALGLVQFALGLKHSVPGLPRFAPGLKHLALGLRLFSLVPGRFCGRLVVLRRGRSFSCCPLVLCQP